MGCGCPSLGHRGAEEREGTAIGEKPGEASQRRYHVRQALPRHRQAASFPRRGWKVRAGGGGGGGREV